MDVFFFAGIALVIAALVSAYVGIRGAATFPPSRAILAGGIALFALIVGTTLAFAIDLSEEEQQHREEELAMEEQEAQAEEAPAGEQAPAGATELAVSSPADGSLVFDPDGLEAQPGALSITYENPSAVPHSLALENAQGEVRGETSVFTNGEESVEISDLPPGEYVFFCTVPGHREAGMEGDLTVGG
jgi:plastocyanin